jgi:hypothetical protein
MSGLLAGELQNLKFQGIQSALLQKMVNACTGAQPLRHPQG